MGTGELAMPPTWDHAGERWGRGSEAGKQSSLAQSQAPSEGGARHTIRGAGIAAERTHGRVPRFRAP